VRAGKVKALAVTSAQRSALVPDLPTVAEAGVQGYEAATWYGVLTPRGTPESVVARLNERIVATLKTADFRERLAVLGFEPVISTPREFGDFLRADIARWARTIKEAGIRLE
jgi:tripartite-type tricarboxylate transporter receptor subunit TctC